MKITPDFTSFPGPAEAPGHFFHEARVLFPFPSLFCRDHCPRSLFLSASPPPSLPLSGDPKEGPIREEDPPLTAPLFIVQRI